MVGGCGFVVAAGLGAWAAGECSEECCLRGPCDCLGNSSIGYRAVCLTLNAGGCLEAAQIIKSACVAGASYVCYFFVFCFFGDYVSVSGRRG